MYKPRGEAQWTVVKVGMLNWLFCKIVASPQSKDNIWKTPKNNLIKLYIFFKEPVFLGSESLNVGLFFKILLRLEDLLLEWILTLSISVNFQIFQSNQVHLHQVGYLPGCWERQDSNSRWQSPQGSFSLL